MPCPPPGDLPDQGIEPGSLALQADALPSEPPRGGSPPENSRVTLADGPGKRGWRSCSSGSGPSHCSLPWTGGSQAAFQTPGSPVHLGKGKLEGVAGQGVLALPLPVRLGARPPPRPPVLWARPSAVLCPFGCAGSPARGVDPGAGEETAPGRKWPRLPSAPTLPEGDWQDPLLRSPSQACSTSGAQGGTSSSLPTRDLGQGLRGFLGTGSHRHRT